MPPEGGSTVFNSLPPYGTIDTLLVLTMYLAARNSRIFSVMVVTLELIMYATLAAALPSLKVAEVGAISPVLTTASGQMSVASEITVLLNRNRTIIAG
jgi:hypothetical protein